MLSYYAIVLAQLLAAPLLAAPLDTEVAWDSTKLPFTQSALIGSIFGFVTLFAAFLLFSFSLRYAPRLVRAMRKVMS